MDASSAPWGKDETVRFLAGLGSLKLLHVEPGHQLSLQKHDKRSEHWIVLSGEVDVLVSDSLKRLERGQHVEIPRDTWHRLSNKHGTRSALVAEIQVSEYDDVQEAKSDILRKQDDYGRGLA